ncbi:MAG: gamma-glutamyltransferase, partial [Bdellovibrionota bacterium]
GSGLITPDFGIALNNEMDDFTTRPGVPNMFGLIQGEANSVRAGARPLSSMSPTIVEKEGKTVLVLGAPGGPRIISGVLQVLYRVISRGMDVESAIYAPRVHHQFLPDSVKTDAMKLPPESIEGLKSRGHVVEFSSTAKVYGIVRDNGRLMGAADNRGEGAAGGY